MKPVPKRCEGAALVESCIVIILLCLILFGMLQLSILTAAHDVIAYAASSGVRCAAVGYDDDMVQKSIYLSAIPNLGPKPDLAVSEEKQIGKQYLLSQQGGGQLNYEYWDTLPVTTPSRSLDMITLTLNQNYPLAFPFARAFYGADEVVLSSGEVKMMNHAALYLGN